MVGFKRKKRRARSSRKGAQRGRLLFLVLSLVAAGLVLWQWEDLVAGLRVHIGSLAGAPEIADLNALDGMEKRSSDVVRVQGIPDYESRLRVRSAQGVVTCFRMVGFENRLFVCTDAGLKTPEVVEDVLREASFTGSLQQLAGSRFQEAVSRGFPGERGIRPGPGAWLLLTGGLQGPSLLRTVLLAVCALLCILFLLRFIVSLIT